jgi:hypothetical protein
MQQAAADSRQQTAEQTATQSHQSVVGLKHLLMADGE